MDWQSEWGWRVKCVFCFLWRLLPEAWLLKFFLSNRYWRFHGVMKPETNFCLARQPPRVHTLNTICRSNKFYLPVKIRWYERMFWIWGEGAFKHVFMSFQFSNLLWTPKCPSSITCSGSARNKQKLIWKVNHSCYKK